MTRTSQFTASMNQKQIILFWLPLAASWLLMSAEGPILQATIARLGDVETQLAAFGIVFSIEVTIESPVIMLLATSTTLVTDARSYYLLRRFVIWLNGGVTLVAVLLAFTPVFDLLIYELMGIPEQIGAAVRPGMKIMILWSAVIGIRRFQQGVLIRHGETRWVGYGTLLRLSVTAGSAVGLAMLTELPGVAIASVGLMSGVVVEALLVGRAVRPTLRRLLVETAEADKTPLPSSSSLSMRDVVRYHTPLAATSFLTLMVGPLIGATLAQMPDPNKNLAAWPVVWWLLFVFRSPGFSLPEAVITLTRRRELFEPVRRFCRNVGIASSLALALLVATPLLDFYLDLVAGIPELASLVLPGLVVAIAFPFLNAWHSWFRGLLMAASDTRTIYRGICYNLLVTVVVLIVGVLAQTRGVVVAVVALMAATFLEVLYLRSCHRRPVPPIGPET